MDEYPDEIRYRPTPLVALLGAQDLYSAIEKGIPLKKDQNNTREVPSIRLLSLDLKDGLPQPKDPNTRKNSHEYTRQPDGLLKANWMHRVVHRYPAVAAIFLDWDAPDWKTREPEIFTIIDNLRYVLIWFKGVNILCCYFSTARINLSASGSLKPFLGFAR
jgi:hypothetical protein